MYESTGFFTAIFRPLAVVNGEVTGEVAGFRFGELFPDRSSQAVRRTSFRRVRKTNGVFAIELSDPPERFRHNVNHGRACEVRYFRAVGARRSASGSECPRLPGPRVACCFEGATRTDPLPCWRHLPEEEIRRRIVEMVDEIDAEHARRVVLNGRAPLGVEEIRKQNPHDGPVRTKKLWRRFGGKENPTFFEVDLRGPLCPGSG